MRDLRLRDGVAFKTVLGEGRGAAGAEPFGPQLETGTCVCRMKLINK